MKPRPATLSTASGTTSSWWSGCWTPTAEKTKDRDREAVAVLVPPHLEERGALAEGVAQVSTSSARA